MGHVDSLVLVYLANGVQGGAVARAALAQGLRVRAIVRNATAADALRASGAEIASGDLRDRAFLDSAYAGVARVVLQLPVAERGAALEMATHAIAAARAAKVKALVLKLPSASRAAPCIEQSFVVSAAIETLVRGSGLPHAVVRPTLYLENLLKPGVRCEIAGHGVIEMPVAIDQRIAWTSVEDCADAALRVQANGGDYRIAGPVGVTGEELASLFSIFIGRRVRFRSQSVEAFEAEVSEAMGRTTARTVAAKFRYFRDQAADADAILARPFKAQSGLEGFVPQTIAQWLARHAPAFRAVR